MWEEISTISKGNDILLVTQFDKMRTALEGQRVLNRLQSQAMGQFKKIFPVSLLQAIEASDDFSVWQGSGAASFIEYLVPHLLEVVRDRAARQPGFQRHATHQASEMVVEHVAEVVPQEPFEQTNAPAQNCASDVVTPRRVRIKTRIKPRTARPEARSSDSEKLVLASLRQPLDSGGESNVSDQGSVDATG